MTETRAYAVSNREAVCELPPLYASATVNLHVMRGPGEEYSGATRTAKTATIATSEQRNDSVTTPARKQQRLNNGAPPGDGFAFTSYEPHRPPFVSAIEPQTAQCGTRGLYATITGRDPPPLGDGAVPSARAVVVAAALTRCCCAQTQLRADGDADADVPAAVPPIGSRG